MPLLNGRSGADVLDSIKDKLGFGGGRDYYDEGDYDNDYDAYSDNFDDYSTYDDDDRYDSVKTRPSSAMTYQDARLTTSRRVSGESGSPYRYVDYSRPRYDDDRYASSISYRDDNYRSNASSSRRKLSIITPASYNDAERVCRGLRVGDAVILNLANTMPDLRKRILDFSFGAASMSGAKVDCIGDMVYVITDGAPLTQAELSRLRTQGVVF